MWAALSGLSLHACGAAGTVAGNLTLFPRLQVDRASHMGTYRAAAVGLHTCNFASQSTASGSLLLWGDSGMAATGVWYPSLSVSPKYKQLLGHYFALCLPWLPSQVPSGS